MTTPKFPQDFREKSHPVVPGATQWTYAPKDQDTVISIVGGGYGLYGDGVRTFEMFDFREDGPQGYLTEEEINEHLEAHPIE